MTTRVLMVTARFLPELGGIETHVAEVSRRIAASSDCAVTVLTTDRSGALPKQESVEGVDVLRTTARPRNRDYYLAPGLVRVIRDGDWDLVHVQGIHNAVPVIAMSAARSRDLPYVVSFHTGGNSLAYRNRLRSTQWRMLSPLLRQADQLIGVSRFEADSVARSAGIDPGRVRVVRNGGSLPPATVEHPESALITSTGRLEKYKGHQRVIAALPQVIAAVPEARLEILGSGPYEAELHRLSRSLGVHDRVTIRQVPPTDRQAMSDALARSKVVAVMSDYEAHPVGVMEAIGLGRPVIGLDTSGVGELVREGWVEGVSSPTDTGELAERIVAVLCRGEAQGSSNPVGLPSWDGCANELRSIYAGVLSARRGG